MPMSRSAITMPGRGKPGRQSHAFAANNPDLTISCHWEAAVFYEFMPELKKV